MFLKTAVANIHLRTYCYVMLFFTGITLYATAPHKLTFTFFPFHLYVIAELEPTRGTHAVTLASAVVAMDTLPSSHSRKPRCSVFPAVVG